MEKTMALPVIDAPTFDLEVPGVKGVHKFRPFLVKENKILTLAVASEDSKEMYSACCQIIQNCYFGDLDIKDLAMYQMQWIFIKIRDKSIGSIQNFSLSCGQCGDIINYDMDLNDFEVVGDVGVIEKKLEISEDVGIVLKQPSSKVQLLHEELSDTEILISCIDYIYNGEEIVKPEEENKEELIEFIDNMPVNLLNEAADFFSKMPSLQHSVEYKCTKCETENKILINGYEHFFG